MGWLKRICPPAGVVWTGLASAGLLAGCYPKDNEARALLMPEPNGTFVHRVQDVQAKKAEASDFVFFLDEWYKGGTALGPHGTYHLGHIIPRLPEVPFPVVIQPSPDAALNETRRQTLVAALLKRGVADAEERVIIAFPDAEGLNGEEAERIYLESLRPNRYLGYGAYGPLGYGNFGGYGGYGAFGRPGYLPGGFIPGVNPFGY
jgi:hypothetical protein